MRATDAGACGGCRRRCGLLAALAAALEHRCRERTRLLDLLALDDDELIGALGGSRRGQLRAEYEEGALTVPANGRQICRHDTRYPAALGHAGAPRMLSVAGGLDRLRALTARPAVAVVGSERPSDYGVEMAASLGRGLSAAGITVAGGLWPGIGLAALRGAATVRGPAIAVMPDGLAVTPPAFRRTVLAGLLKAGCGVCELPGHCRTRCWGAAAGERILAALAAVVVVVEARAQPRDLGAAVASRRLGRGLAAVPGRVTSPLSAGGHALLQGGASLVRGAEDVLELLAGPSRPGCSEGRGRTMAATALEARLGEVLERVGIGEDTPDRLARGGGEPGELLLALSELELLGLLVRGEGGRYVPREPFAVDPEMADSGIGSDKTSI